MATPPEGWDASSPFVKFMLGKFPCAAGSRSRGECRAGTGESQPSWPDSLPQLPNPHPVDPPLDHDLACSPSPTSRRNAPPRPFHNTGMLARQTGAALVGVT